MDALEMLDVAGARLQADRMKREGRNLITQEEAARMLGIDVKTLACWRYRGKGPAFVRCTSRAARIMYTPVAVQEFVQQRCAAVAVAKPEPRLRVERRTRTMARKVDRSARKIAKQIMLDTPPAPAWGKLRTKSERLAYIRASLGAQQ